MKSYWIKRGEFGNQYGLAYCNSTIDEEQAQSAGYERITRKEAIAKCREERDREKYNPASAGYASRYIYPFMSDTDYYYTNFDAYPWVKSGYFVVKA